jgi:hypothetical protein
VTLKNWKWVAVRMERVANKERSSMCHPCDMDALVQDGIRGQSLDFVDIQQHGTWPSISAKFGQAKAR